MQARPSEWTGRAVVSEGWGQPKADAEGMTAGHGRWWRRQIGRGSSRRDEILSPSQFANLMIGKKTSEHVGVTG